MEIDFEKMARELKARGKKHSALRYLPSSPAGLRPYLRVLGFVSLWRQVLAEGLRQRLPGCSICSTSCCTIENDEELGLVLWCDQPLCLVNIWTFFLSINSYPLFSQPLLLTYICPLLWCACFFVHVLYFFDTEFSVSFHIRIIVNSCVIVAVVTSHSAFIPLWHSFLLHMMSMLFICHTEFNIDGQTGRHLLKKMLVWREMRCSFTCVRSSKLG